MLELGRKVCVKKTQGKEIAAMPLVCPQCKQVYEQHNMCPLCNVVLMYHAKNIQTETPAPSAAALDDDFSEWQQAPWGKIVIGLIMAQGLSHGLRQLLTAGFLAGGDSTDVWNTLWGLVLMHSIAAVSLLIGGAITGASQSRGILYGAMLGLANGTLSMLLQGRFQELTGSLLPLTEPLLHLATGALGGALGMLIWRPAPVIPELENTPSTPIPTLNLEQMFGPLFAGPIHMGRVCAGAFLVVAGVVWSKAILEFLLRASQNTLTISSHLQAQLISMEISGLIALVGAAFAGATTANGLKQGLCVGLGASVVVVGVQLSNPKFALESLIFTVGGIVVIALVGGGFGSRLFPPVQPGKRRRRFVYD